MAAETTLREITRDEQPSYDPISVWAAGGAAPPDAGIDAPVIWIREDSQGRELWRGVWTADELPSVGDEVERSPVDGRMWAVAAVERADGGLSELQDSMRPVEVGDAEFRAGLAEVRELLAPLPDRAREILRRWGR